MSNVNFSGGVSTSATLQDYADIGLKFKTILSSSEKLASSARSVQLSRDGQPYLVQARTGATLRITKLFIAIAKIFNIDLTDKFKHPNDERIQYAHNDFVKLLQEHISGHKFEFVTENQLTPKDISNNLYSLPADVFDELLNAANPQSDTGSTYIFMD